MLALDFRLHRFQVFQAYLLLDHVLQLPNGQHATSHLIDHHSKHNDRQIFALVLHVEFS
jgi:hypothetical protein